MAIVWVIESPVAGLATVTRELIGNFPIRCIASLASFERLSRIEKTWRPHIVVINLEHFSETPDNLLKKITTCLPNVLTIGIKKHGEDILHVSFNTYIFSADHPSYSLTDFLSTIEHQPTKTNNILHYKDMLLNLQQFSVRIQPSEQFESLSALEFRLLRLFISNPTHCYSRQELIEHIWDGMKVAARTVDSQISRLRRRLADSECQIESVYGGGYRLV